MTEVVEEKNDIFLGMKGEMCSQISPIEENMYNLRERSSNMAPDYTLEKSDSPPPYCYSGVVDNSSYEILLSQAIQELMFLLMLSILPLLIHLEI